MLAYVATGKWGGQNILKSFFEMLNSFIHNYLLS